MRLTYANVVSTLALVIAVGGGSAYAATTLARNSVGARQIKTNAVGSSELKRGAVHSADIAKTTINSLRGAKGDPGPQGPAGPAGAAAVSYFAAVSGAGQILRGSATGSHTAVGSGSYTIGFPRNVSECGWTVTPGGIDATSQPPTIVTTRDDGGKVGVQLYDLAGNPVDRSFGSAARLGDRLG